MEVSGQLHAPAALHPEDRTSLPKGYGDGLAQKRVWTRW